jgi:hypothetical protein
MTVAKPSSALYHFFLAVAGLAGSLQAQDASNIGITGAVVIN